MLSKPRGFHCAKNPPDKILTLVVLGVKRDKFGQPRLYHFRRDFDLVFSAGLPRLL